MNTGKSLAASTLARASGLMAYEILISRPGMKERDTNFIWASNFRAPIGVSFSEDNVFFNLFLPDGSDKDQEKKLFLNRVGAKLIDGLWQVRRGMDEVTGNYGMGLKLAIGRFRSSILDHVYVQNGRFYSHFVFSAVELPDVSDAIMNISNEIEDLRIEYLKKLDGQTSLFNTISEDDDASVVTISISPSDNGSQGKDGEMFFVMGNAPDGGVKIVAKGGEKEVPEVLSPVDAVELGSDITSFHSGNGFLKGLVEQLMSNYIVVHGFYGSAAGETVNLSIIVPSRQASPLVRILNSLVESLDDVKIQLQEITGFGDLAE